MKKWIQNLLLATTSIVLTLVIVEVLLRAVLYNGNPAFDLLRKPRLYADYERDGTEHLYKEDYWKMRYLFSARHVIQKPHPVLGWLGNFDPKTYEHADEFFSKGNRPVLLFGDSFSQCVDTTRCFEDQLNSDSTFTSEFYLLNYGVGGYGVDQIHLLMDRAVPRFENPIVVFGMLTTDLDRSMLAFRDAPKPSFTLEKGQLQLRDEQLKLSSEEYVVQHPLKIRSYVLRIILNSLRWLVDTEPSEKTKQKITELNEAIIRKQIGQLNERGIRPLVLLFQPIDQPEDEWRCRFLLDLFQELDIPVLDTRKVLLEDMAKTGRSESDYFIPKDLHPNSSYNRIIAEELKERVTGMK